MRHSIQWRLQLWHGAMLLLVLAAFASLAYRSAWLEELRRVDAELGESLDQMLRMPGGRRMPPPPGNGMPRDFLKKGPPPPGFAGGPPPGGVDEIQSEVVRNIWEIERTRPASRQQDYYLFLNHDGGLLARSTNAPAGVPLPQGAQPPPRPEGRFFLQGPPMMSQREARSRGNYREVYRVLPLGDAIIAGRSLEGAAFGMMRRLAWIAFAGLGLLAAGLAGGWWITRRALAPIQDISRTASEIASGDLGRRIDVASGQSELGQMAGVLNDTFNRLQASFDRQARFTSDASHELRTPISVIISKAQMALSRERSPGEYQDALRMCLRAAQRMRSLTESLLTLSRQDARAEVPPAEAVDLAAIAGETLDFLAGRAAEQGIELQRECTGAPVTGDAGRLSQVVTNLVTNALQHTPADGVVTVRTGQRDGHAFLEVIDTGRGIAPEDLPHVFDRFYRADKSRTGQAGTGLGLSITRGIVEAHGGRIEVRSTPGEGAAFLVTMPLAPAELLAQRLA